MAKHDPNIDALSHYGRDRDRAYRIELDLPTTGPETPRHTGPALADLEAFAGIGQRPDPSSAATQRRVRDTWHR